MTYLGASAAALATDRNAWHTRADQAWGASRSWNNGASFETDLANMTNDRNYWKTTVAHDDPNVWTNRYNAGVSAANAAIPAPSQLSPVTNATTYGTSETTLMTITANRSGYWWAAGSIINADGGTTANVTVRIRMAGTQQATVTYFNFVNGGAGSGLVSTSTPVLLSNGQTITLTAQMASGSMPSTTPKLTAGFVPSPSNPA